MQGWVIWLRMAYSSHVVQGQDMVPYHYIRIVAKEYWRTRYSRLTDSLGVTKNTGNDLCIDSEEEQAMTVNVHI